MTTKSSLITLKKKKGTCNDNIKSLCSILGHINKSEYLMPNMYERRCRNRVRSKASLDKNNNDRTGNNDIYIHIPIHKKQTINVLRVFHPHASVQFPSSFHVHIYIILGNFCFRYKSSRSSRSFILIGLPFLMTFFFLI